MGHRSEALGGSVILNSSFSPPTLTGKFAMLFFPESTVITSILDESGVDVKANYINGSLTVVANHTITVDELGGYFTSITISSGSVTCVNA